MKLIIEPHIYNVKSKAKDVGCKARFECTGCAKLNKYVGEKAELISRDTDGNEEYSLSDWPKACDHVSSVFHLKPLFMNALYAQVEANPEKSVGKIYTEEREKIIRDHDLSSVQKDQFFALIPTQRNVQSNLNLFKKEFVPHQPNSQDDFNPWTDWFKLPGNDEIITKADLKVGSSRIIFFATDYMLKVFARAAAISGDGTFKMAPKHWKQLFILCAEISWLGIWVPCAFAILPDKKQSTYKALFELVNQNLNRINEKLAAEFFMCDFEIGIRSSFREIWPEITLKGCHFHYAKCIWKQVVNAGLKEEYSKKKDNEELVELIAAAIGMAYVPLEELKVGDIE